MDLASSDFDLSKILSGCDTVIHLAARTHILKESSSNPIEEFREINVDGTLRLANQAAKCNVRRFIFLSSIGVNGYHTNLKPFFHNDLLNPHNSYTISKFEAEEGLKKIRMFKVNLFFLKFILKFFFNNKTIESLLGDLEIDINYTKETLNWKPPFDPEKFIIENL